MRQKAYPPLNTRTLNDLIEDAGEIFTSMSTLNVPESKQSRPQNQLSTWPNTHNEVCCGAKK